MRVVSKVCEGEFGEILKMMGRLYKIIYSVSFQRGRRTDCNRIYLPPGSRIQQGANRGGRRNVQEIQEKKIGGTIRRTSTSTTTL